MGQNGLIVIPDRLDPKLTTILSEEAKKALEWIVQFYKDVSWVVPKLTPENIEHFLTCHHCWFYKGSPHYRNHVLDIPMPKFSKPHDMTKEELAEMEPWVDRTDPDNRTRPQVNVDCSVSEESIMEKFPPNKLRPTTVKVDTKAWPTDLERQLEREEETIDLTKSVSPTGSETELEGDKVEIITPEKTTKKPATLTPFSLLYKFQAKQNIFDNK